MKTSLTILAAASLFLFPFATFAADNGPQEAQTYEVPPVAQPLVREGDFAIKLAALYGLGARRMKPRPRTCSRQRGSSR